MAKITLMVLLLTGCASTNCAKDLTKSLSECPLPKRSHQTCEVPVVNKNTGRVTCLSRDNLSKILRGY